MLITVNHLGSRGELREVHGVRAHDGDTEMVNGEMSAQRDGVRPAAPGNVVSIIRRQRDTRYWAQDGPTCRPSPDTLLAFNALVSP
jgi:hypothetical protein